MTKVSACIVNYKDLDHITKALKSIIDNTRGVDLSLYVVDNASNDGSAEKIEQEFPQVTVIKLDKNYGFGKGHNAVLPFIDSEYHAVINPDIVLCGDTLTELSEYFDSDKTVGIACPMILNPDMTPQLLPRKTPTVKYLLAGRLPGMKKIRDEYTMANADMSRVQDVDFVTGCFMFMRTELFKKVGGFDERYFMYIEDADLAREIKRYARAVHYPGAKAVHEWSRADIRNMKLFGAHISSVFKYFRKWKKSER